MQDLGIKIPTLIREIESHRLECDLIDIGGPTLSLYYDSNGDLLIYYWVDNDDFVNRWLVFRISQEIYEKFSNGELSLKTCLLSSGESFCFVVDFDSNWKALRASLLPIQDVPTDYLPLDNFYYHLSPIFRHNRVYSSSKSLAVSSMRYDDDTLVESYSTDLGLSHVSSGGVLTPQYS